jgi:hypothetical protein
MDRKVLAEKSMNFVILETTGIILSLGLWLSMAKIFTVNGDNIILILSIIFFISLIMTIYLTFKTFLKPKFLLEYDYNGVYLKHKKDLYIFFKDINKVYGSPATTRYKTYKFGTLYINTKDKVYRIGIIKDVKSAEKIISRLSKIKRNR